VFKPRLVYNSTTLNLELALLPWSLSERGIGGTAVSAAGIHEVYTIREDSIARLTFRVLEQELDDFRDFVRFARSSGEPFEFRFDQDEVTTEYDVILHAPLFPDSVEFMRESSFLPMFMVDLEFRALDRPFNTFFLEDPSS
jgi:hypothetical protein